MKSKKKQKTKKNTCNIRCLLVLSLTGVASKTLKGAVKMLEKYIGTRSEHYGEIKTFSTEGMLTLKMQMGNRHLTYAYKTHTFLNNERHSLCWKHSLSLPADNEMQSHGRRG